MSWRTVHASAVGTSHVAQGLSCDDDCWSSVDTSPGRAPTLSIFVADGAGSAANGGAGARIAIETAARWVSQKIAESTLVLDEGAAFLCVDSIRHAIAASAEASGSTPRDYACTFLGLLSAGCETVAFQIGDGAMALDVGGGLEMPIIPMQGEYANMTHFVSDEDALDRLQVKIYSSGIQRAAVFSDGLQRLALNLNDNTPYQPFFAPFFKVLAAAGEDQEDELQAALQTFLNSEKVNERTDDDKSLVLAVWSE